MDKLRGIGFSDDQLFDELAALQPVAAKLAAPGWRKDWVLRRDDGTIQAVVIGGFH